MRYFQKKNTKRWWVFVGICIALVVLLQLRQVPITQPVVSANVPVPAPIEQILRKSCYDCHSNETQLKWFDRVAPASWLVASHVMEGRKALNFSEWDKLPPPARLANLYYALNKILTGEMPLKSYTYLHPEAQLSEADISALKDYLISQAPKIDTVGPSSDAIAKKTGVQQHDTAIEAAPNGIAYIPDYRNWKAISTSDRFDNGTMRIIYGNEIAVKAIKEGKINPWPDGTILAKVAWKQVEDKQGIIHNGEFWQVEFMMKDKKQYTETNGWGWARWRGKELKPYGANALFTAECIACHKPMKDNDLVFTNPLKLK